MKQICLSALVAALALCAHGEAPPKPDMSNAKILGNEVYNWKAPYTLPEAAPEKTIHVTDNTSLQKAVDAATGGELIILAPGDYGAMRFQKKSFEQPVTLAAAPGKRPKFESLWIKNSDNPRLENLHFAMPPSDGKGHHNLLRMDNVTGAQVRHCAFTGAIINNPEDQRDGFGDGMGLFGGNWNDCLVEYNEFTCLGKAISLRNIENTTLAHNYIHDYRSDAFYLSEAKNCLIEFNLVEDNFAFHLPKGRGDHPDMLQGSLDHVTIRNNYFNQGKGTHSQGIFISGSSKKSGFEGTSNIIENNLVHVGMGNAIMLGNMPNSVARNNTLLENRNGKTNNWPTKIYTRGPNEGSKLENNIGPRVDANDGATAEGNITIQRTDPAGPDYVNNYVTNGAADAELRLKDFRPVPGADGQLPTAGADFSVFEAWLKQ